MSYFTSTIHVSSIAPVNSVTINRMRDVWSPLKLVDETDELLPFKQNFIQYKDGSKVYKSDCLLAVRDVKAHGTSLTWLTTAQNYSTFYDPTNLSIDTYINTYGFIFAYIRVVTPSSGSAGARFLSSSNNNVILTDSSRESIRFKISKVPNTNKVTISFKTIESSIEKEYFLSVNSNTYDCSFQEINSPTESAYIQQFFTSFNNSNALFFYNDNETSRYIGADDFNNVKAMGIKSEEVQSRYSQVTDTLESNRNINYYLELITESTANYRLDVDQHRSTSWVKYYNELLDKNSLKSVDIDLENTIDNIPVNHLITGSYEGNIDISTNSINVNHMILKNVLTPEYNYTLKPNTNTDGVVVQDTELNKQPVQRTYNKIFCGDHVELGYDKPLLTFTSNTQLLELPPGDTYFHYPHAAYKVNLNDSALFQSGALAGDCPATSDRIFKKNANYKYTSIWGDSQQEIVGGEWLCAWLSGSVGSTISNDKSGVWVDRWYDPSKLTSNDALAEGGSQLTVTDTEVVYQDVPTQLTLDPGVYYRYTRPSTDDFITITDSYNTNLTALTIHYNDWDKTITDKSVYKNDANVVSDVEILNIGPDFANLEQTSIVVDDDSYIEIPYSESLALTGSFTATMYVYSDNWTDNPGNIIFSNGFRGGINFEYNRHFYNPTVSIIEDTFSHVLQYSLCNRIADTRLSEQ